MLNLAELPFLKTFEPTGRLKTIINQIQSAINAIAQQTGTDPTGVITAPAKPAQLMVTQANGIVKAAITDNPANVRPGIRYFLEASPDPAFPKGSTEVHYLGPGRNWRNYIGNESLYFRAYSQYQNSPTSEPVYFAGAVTGGGSSSPNTPPLTGSGTTTLSGHGFGPQVQRTTAGFNG